MGDSILVPTCALIRLSGYVDIRMMMSGGVTNVSFFMVHSLLASGFWEFVRFIWDLQFVGIVLFIFYSSSFYFSKTSRNVPSFISDFSELNLLCFLLVPVANGSSILSIFSKSQLLVLFIFSLIFLFSILFIAL